MKSRSAITIYQSKIRSDKIIELQRGTGKDLLQGGFSFELILGHLPGELVPVHLLPAGGRVLPLVDVCERSQSVRAKKTAHPREAMAHDKK